VLESFGKYVVKVVFVLD